MSGKIIPSLSVDNEFSRLRQVIIGQGSPYQQDKTQVAAEMSEFPFVPDTDRREKGDGETINQTVVVGI